MTRYEYKIVVFYAGDNIADALNTLGDKGWELAAVTTAPMHEWVFKRPAHPTKPCAWCSKKVCFVEGCDEHAFVVRGPPPDPGKIYGYFTFRFCSIECADKIYPRK